MARQVGARALPSVDALLDAADAIVIAAATDAHAELVRAGIARRIPTYCEKPLAGTLDETIAVAELVEASGVPFQLGFQRRFDPGYREARRMVESGELGTVYAVRLAGHDPAPPHESYIPASGGLFRDFSVHDFDVIRWLLGARGRRGLRRWRRPGLPRVRQVRRRRHGRGHAAHGGRHPGRAHLRPPRSAGL